VDFLKANPEILIFGLLLLRAVGFSAVVWSATRLVMIFARWIAARR
jgi:hypothetical protein